MVPPNFFAACLAESAGVPSQIVIAKKQTTDATGGDDSTVFVKAVGVPVFPTLPMGGVSGIGRTSSDVMQGTAMPYYTDGDYILAGDTMTQSVTPSIQIGDIELPPHYDAVNGNCWWGSISQCVYYSSARGWIYITGKSPGYEPLEYTYRDSTDHLVYGGDAFYAGSLPTEGGPQTWNARGSATGTTAVTLSYKWVRYTKTGGGAGEYINTANSTDKKLFGLPQWTDGESGDWVRSLQVDGRYYNYEGVLTVATTTYDPANVAISDTMTYTNLIRHTTSGWCIGEALSAEGWYVGSEPSKTEARTYTFTATTKSQKPLGLGAYMVGVTSEIYTGDEVRYGHTPNDPLNNCACWDDTVPAVAWWQLSTDITANLTWEYKTITLADKTLTFGDLLRNEAAISPAYADGVLTYNDGNSSVYSWVANSDNLALAGDNVTFAFTYNSPGGGSPPPGENIVVSMLDYLMGTAPTITYDATNSKFYIGTVGDVLGWCEVSASAAALTQTVTLTFTPAVKEHKVFSFADWLQSNERELVHYDATPDLVTAYYIAGVSPHLEWYQADDAATAILDASRRWNYTIVTRPNVVLTFDSYVMGDNTIPVYVGNFEVWE